MPSNRVVILTPYHSIDGEMQYTEKRLSDHLNARQQTAIDVRNASIARLKEPNRILQRHSLAVIPKEWIVIAFEPQVEPVRGTGRLYAFVKKVPIDVFIALEAMEVRGTYHSSVGVDLHRLLTDPPDPFFPVTKPSITLYENERLLLKPEAILLNVRHIHYFAKVEVKPEQKPEATQPVASNPPTPPPHADVSG
jgi:hypothetical protein